MKTPIAALLLTLLLAGNFHIMAQEAEPVMASVSYEFIHVNDTNDRENPLREEMILRLGQRSSCYNSLTIEKNREAEAKRTEELIQNYIRSGRSNTEGGKAVLISTGAIMTININTTEGQLYKYPNENSLVSTSTIGDKMYVVASPLPEIDWEIGEASKRIGDYTCQQATGTYGGRTYTAWFTTDLPFQNGPWKLSGLPGLILEATDTKKEVAFLFKEVSRDSTITYINQISMEAIKTSEKSLSRLKEEYQKDPETLVKSQFQRPVNVTIRYIDALGNSIPEAKAKAIMAKNNNLLEISR